MQRLVAEAHVWQAVLDTSYDRLLEFFALLSEEERARARALVRTRERDRFVAARGLLKTILGRYLDVAPGEVRLSRDAHGKPVLAHSDLCFNLTHSEDLALLAVTRARRIGIDLERVRPLPEASKMIEWYFSAEEHREFAALAEDRKSREFFRRWTRREAALKAIGKGLTESLRKAEPLAVEGQWTQVELDVEPLHVAALAVEGPALPIRRFDWNAATGPDA